MKILVTGAAGFIGANLVLRLLESAEPLQIVNIDNLNDYYDPSLKEYRLGLIEAKAAAHPGHKYTFVKGDLSDRALINTSPRRRVCATASRTPTHTSRAT